MKTFAAILLLSLVSAISAEVSCDECKGWVGALQAYLLTDEDLEAQCQLLTDTLCPEAEDPEGCAAGFHNWWALIGKAMYPVFLEPAGLCMDLGACTMKSLATGTCEECTAGVMSIAEIVGSEEKLVQIIDFLKGDDFCGTTPDVETCGTIIEMTMPYAMPVLAAALSGASLDLCTNVAMAC